MRLGCYLRQRRRGGWVIVEGGGEEGGGVGEGSIVGVAKGEEVEEEEG